MTQARSRRRFMKTAFIATLGAGVVGVGGVLVRFCTRAMSPMTVSSSSRPAMCRVPVIRR